MSRLEFLTRHYWAEYRYYLKTKVWDDVLLPFAFYGLYCAGRPVVLRIPFSLLLSRVPLHLLARIPISPQDVVSYAIIAVSCYLSRPLMKRLRGGR